MGGTYNKTLSGADVVRILALLDKIDEYNDTDQCDNDAIPSCTDELRKIVRVS